MTTVFPDFKPLTFDDKDDYIKLIQQFPPVSDLSFSTLMIWWNFENSAKVSKIENNLLINYKLPGDEINSGIGFVGTDNVDKSMLQVFARLREEGRAQRLVHVPQFVIDSIQHPEHFVFEEERDYDEYIMDPKAIYPLENADHNFRRKVKKFINAVAEEGKEISLRTVDLTDPDIQKLLLDKAYEWWTSHNRNDADGNEKVAMRIAIEQSAELQTQNLCLFIDGELHGFQLYQVSHDGKYLIMNHLKVSYQYPRMFDYMTYEGMGEAVKRNIPYVNQEMDLGIAGLRAHKMEMKPIDFFRKYTITPSAK